MIYRYFCQYKLSYIFILFLISSFNTIHSQSFINNSEGVWIENNNAVFSINSKNSSIFNKIGEYINYLKISFRETDSILSFQGSSYNFATDAQKTAHYIFKVLENDCCNMRVVPINDLAITFLGTEDTLSFLKIKKPVINNITFEELFFFRQEDFYNYYVRIDKDKNFEMIKKYNRRNTDKETNFFKGRIDGYFFNQLIEKIKLSNLNKLEYEIITDCGGCSKNSLIVKFKNRIFTHKDFGITPVILEDLVNYIIALSKSYKLQESSSKFYFDTVFID